MRVRIISFGTNWWSAHSSDLSDPLCFSRRAAWFNSAGLKYGRRLRLSWVFFGHIRFNRSSGLHPEYPLRSVGKTFNCTGPNYLHGRTHLLISTPADGSAPDCFLITVNERSHGRISFASRAWRSEGVQPISVSLHGPRYEAMLLISVKDWIETDLGRWTITEDGNRLALDTRHSGDTV
jgi:hypothetical protein